MKNAMDEDKSETRNPKQAPNPNGKFSKPDASDPARDGSVYGILAMKTRTKNEPNTMTTKTPNLDKVKLLARDLRDSKQYPRSPRETLGGYVLAARAVDKCRAVL